MSDLTTGWNMTTGLLGAAILPVDPVSGVSLLAGSVASGVANHVSKGRASHLAHENEALRGEVGAIGKDLQAIEHEKTVLSADLNRAVETVSAQQESIAELNHQRAAVTHQLHRERTLHSQELTHARHEAVALRNRNAALQETTQEQALRLQTLERCRSAEETLVLTEQALIATQQTLQATQDTLEHTQRIFVRAAVTVGVVAAGYMAYRVWSRWAAEKAQVGWGMPYDGADLYRVASAPVQEVVEDDVVPQSARSLSELSEKEAAEGVSSDWDACSEADSAIGPHDVALDVDACMLCSTEAAP
eukprot:TRINITY_DN287_c0_g1_i1.p1 TRINITY_DN287_c0_g1~~TRINITY_DN287_c0_g1_i1.p1  ORF type:complete len:304 (+),score=63.58 TRINITY_DN287_c0_g1_i1:50-961(+)